MKVNAPKRKIFDAVDMLTEEAPVKVPVEAENGVQMLSLDKIKPFHDYPFHLYEGERLDDMVDSIREHGVLMPVIVRKIDDDYEMLSGHNRLNAAKLAGKTEIPAIVKGGLTDQEAYVYVIETNMIQRSFNDLLPSEKAAVMAAQYDKTCSQGKRNDIIRELEMLEGKKNYRDENDWMSHFLEECCEVEKGATEKSGELYQEYRAYCLRNGEYTRSTSDFYSEIEKRGFVRQKTRMGIRIVGIRLKTEVS